MCGKGGAKMTVFKKIINGELPAYKIYEDELTLAFLDIHPAHPGHTLVIPKKEIEFVWDIDDETYSHLLAVSKKIALHIRKTMPDPYVHMSVVGIDVPHAHIHLIPFTETSDFHNPDRMSQAVDHDALVEIQKRLTLL